MKKPLVSVIIPTFSRPIYLKRAIDSIFNQTWPSIEVIVIDDNGEGTPNQLLTHKEVELYSKRPNFSYVVHSNNLKGAAARNTGLKVSEGDFVTFLDDDDEYRPTKIQSQVEALIKAPEIYGAVYSGFIILSEGKELRSRKPKLEGNLQLKLLQLSWGFGTGSNPLFRKVVFEKIGGFDESFIRHQDWEFMVRFFRDFMILKDENVCVVRHVDSSINLPEPCLYLQVKSHFLNTFLSDINAYNDFERRIIYRNQYADVAFHALMQRNFNLAFKYYRKACGYKFLSPRIIMKGLYFFSTQSQVR